MFIETINWQIGVWAFICGLRKEWEDQDEI
jgi:hypothetical protein